MKETPSAPLTHTPGEDTEENTAAYKPGSGSSSATRLASAVTLGFSVVTELPSVWYSVITDQSG